MWLRRELQHGITVRLAIVWLISAAAVAVVTSITTAAGPVSIAVAAVVGGQLCAVVFFAAMLAASPLSYRFVRTYLDQPLQFVPVAGRSTKPALDRAAELARLEYVRTDTIADPTFCGSPVFDLFQSPDRTTTAAVSRSTGAIAFATMLEDGRLVHTANFLVPARDDVVANAAPALAGSDDEAGLMRASHAQVVRRFASQGVVPIATSGGVYVEALRRERLSYEEVGPLLMPFLRIDPDKRPGLGVALDPADIVDRGFLDAPVRERAQVAKLHTQHLEHLAAS